MLERFWFENLFWWWHRLSRNDFWCFLNFLRSTLCVGVNCLKSLFRSIGPNKSQSKSVCRVATRDFQNRCPNWTLESGQFVSRLRFRLISDTNRRLIVRRLQVIIWTPNSGAYSGLTSKTDESDFQDYKKPSPNFRVWRFRWRVRWNWRALKTGDFLNERNLFKVFGSTKSAFFKIWTSLNVWLEIRRLTIWVSIPESNSVQKNIQVLDCHALIFKRFQRYKKL